MQDDRPDLAAWLDKTVDHLVGRTADYLDTRELLMLVQAVAFMRLEQTLRQQVPTPAPPARTKGAAKA